MASAAETAPICTHIQRGHRSRLSCLSSPWRLMMRLGERLWGLSDQRLQHIFECVPDLTFCWEPQTSAHSEEQSKPYCSRSSWARQGSPKRLWPRAGLVRLLQSLPHAPRDGIPARDPASNKIGGKSVKPSVFCLKGWGWTPTLSLYHKCCPTPETRSEVLHSDGWASGTEPQHRSRSDSAMLRGEAYRFQCQRSPHVRRLADKAMKRGPPGLRLCFHKCCNCFLHSVLSMMSTVSNMWRIPLYVQSGSCATALRSGHHLEFRTVAPRSCHYTQ